MDISGFFKTVILASIGTVIVLGVALPVVTNASIPEGYGQAAALSSMLELIPLLLIIAIVLAVVAVAISKRA